jgi:hypothetical protein
MEEVLWRRRGSFYLVGGFKPYIYRLMVISSECLESVSDSGVTAVTLV